jgi:hypothetical protein
MITKRSFFLIFMLVTFICIGNADVFQRMSNRVLGWFHVEAQNRSRFQLIDDEVGPEPKGWWTGLEFEVFHDTQTGQEVICIEGGYAEGSCYLTGRKW